MCLFTDLHKRAPKRLKGQNPECCACSYETTGNERISSADGGLVQPIKPVATPDPQTHHIITFHRYQSNHLRISIKKKKKTALALWCLAAVMACETSGEEDTTSEPPEMSVLISPTRKVQIRTEPGRHVSVALRCASTPPPPQTGSRSTGSVCCCGTPAPALIIHEQTCSEAFGSCQVAFVSVSLQSRQKNVSLCFNNA